MNGDKLVMDDASASLQEQTTMSDDESKFAIGETGDPVDRFAIRKSAAARTAVAEVPDGAVIGLGSGTTVEVMLYELAARVRQGLHVTGVPASERTAGVAAALGIALTELDDVSELSMSIDGADEVTLPHLHLIKGGGGALLREKLIAAASRYRIIIADSRKVVNVLGTTHPVPVEVTPFGWRHTAARLAQLDCRPVLRTSASEPSSGEQTPLAGSPYVTDGGNYILDCHFGAISNPEVVSVAIKTTIGVVEHGLFLSMTDRLVVAGDAGVQVYDRVL